LCLERPVIEIGTAVFFAMVWGVFCILLIEWQKYKKQCRREQIKQRLGQMRQFRNTKD